MTAPVVMVHGAFCGGWVFDRLRQPFEAAGHPVIAPDLRGHGPAGGAAGVSMRDYARDIAELCAAQLQPPILIGHSLGGLVAQMAAEQARVSALVLLAPSAPWGITGFSLEEAAMAFGLYTYGPFWAGAVSADKDLMAEHGLTRVPARERRWVMERLVPESGLALWETLNWWLDPFRTTAVDPRRIGAPVLVVAGGRDRVHPSATVSQTASGLSATLKTMPQMGHWLPGEPGWAEVAGLSLAWLSTSAVAA
jgi:pimeloyl-ACP methyl ester carboxylesterase